MKPAERLREIAATLGIDSRSGDIAWAADIIDKMESRCARYRHALRIIAGDEECIDPTLAHETVARVALQDMDE